MQQLLGPFSVVAILTDTGFNANFQPDPAAMTDSMRIAFAIDKSDLLFHASWRFVLECEKNSATQTADSSTSFEI